MHSLNALLLFAVVTSRLNLGNIRRNKRKTGPKSDVSLTARYAKVREWKRQRRAKGQCVDCKDNSGEHYRCEPCRKIHSKKYNRSLNSRNGNH